MRIVLTTALGKVVARVFGEVHVPDHLDIIDMVTGLTELVPQSSIGKSMRAKRGQQKRKVAQTSDPLGQIYPGILRIMYGVPDTYQLNNLSSLCLAEFQSDNSYNNDDLAMFNQQMDESVSVSQTVGSFVPDPADAESTLDVQVSDTAGNTQMTNYPNSTEELWR